MNDPYVVLGISRDASDEEIKRAYKELARKYHPDNYADNPLSDLAADKMKEINEAYDSIMNSRRGASGAKGAGYNPNAASSFPEVRSLINSGRLEQAQELLDGVPPAGRNAEWYFLNGTVLYRRGWFDEAYTSFVRASQMEPGNAEYKAAANNASRQAGRVNTNPYGNYGGMGECSPCDVCQGLICADCCCECMGGDLIGCC
ncbi:MAG: DnaJ domain-containing protein [Clostridia bacterium]|nr:DnaJ domain-containing protein [Clostridia bacterium]